MRRFRKPFFKTRKSKMSLYFSMQSDKLLKFKPQPTAEAAKEAVAALKAELEMELQNIKQCTYKPYECTQLTLEGHNYCLRHILQDKSAPYKQCAYVYNSNGKRCHLPAPKDKKDTTGYCNEHALKTHLTTSKRNNRCQPPRTAEVLVHSVSHYIRKPRIRTLSSSTQHSDEGRSSPDENNDGLITKSLDPFVDVDANSVLASGSDVLDMCSESESDVEATSYGSIWQDSHADSSDNESIDSEQEDVLKHANIYSAEEVTLITRDKLIRLQSLYIDEFRFLTHVLRERRRRYLYALKREKESCSSVYNQHHDSPKEQRMYKKLKAFNSYHKKHGIEAVCHKRLHERRLKATEGVNLKPPSYSKCVFTEGGVKCGERALPVTRHCRKHILEDPNQILFRACSKMGGDIECTTPVEAIFDAATCRLHMDVPPIRSYSQIRKDSESDYDDTLEAHGPSTSSAHVQHVKLESAENVITPSADLMNISASKMQMIKEEIIDNENSLDTFNFIPDNADVEMPLPSSEHIGDAADAPLSETDVCIGFANPESVFNNYNPDHLATHADDIVMNNLEMNADSIMASELSVIENSNNKQELSAIEDLVVSSEVSAIENLDVTSNTSVKEKAAVTAEISTAEMSSTTAAQPKMTSEVEIKTNTEDVISSTNEMETDSCINTPTQEE